MRGKSETSREECKPISPGGLRPPPLTGAAAASRRLAAHRGGKARKRNTLQALRHEIGEKGVGRPETLPGLRAPTRKTKPLISCLCQRGVIIMTYVGFAARVTSRRIRRDSSPRSGRNVYSRSVCRNDLRKQRNAEHFAVWRKTR